MLICPKCLLVEFLPQVSLCTKQTKRASAKKKNEKNCNTELKKDFGTKRVYIGKIQMIMSKSDMIISLVILKL